MTHPVINLDDLELTERVVHQGEGVVGTHRIFRSGDLAGPWNFVDYAVLPPGHSIGNHRHGDDEELYLVLSGQGTMHLDGRDIPVRAGSLVMNRPGGTHGLRNDSQEPLRIFVVEVARSASAQDRQEGE